ncbi:MAG TPA: 2-amino-4-hydroxy-6-hydroxymethyldihydropteridine diphosphokinase [Candidatus Acidoferrales bacterium]|nr:2-amino-4-hydroxy-6-hydroxymethyldihydropteridine diphosphokinase [Candidatus Acidoferrales bacterium]
MARVYLSLGSNMGDRAANIGRALKELGERGFRIARSSSLYETEPVEVRDQPWFLNSVAEGETKMEPEELLEAALAVERLMGRERRVQKGPRVIDIDMLLYDGAVIHRPGLEIPHPRMAERRFVLAPMAEIAPAAMHPVLKKTMATLLAETPDRSEVRRAPVEGSL